MKMYIQIENNLPINHPAFEENLLQAFGKIPLQWESFVRIEPPTPAIYQILDTQNPMYSKVDGMWTDVWVLRDMTNNEIADKQQAEKNRWSSLPNRENFSTWVFDETLCQYVAPVSKPDGDFIWSGVKNNWVEVPPYPNDGKLYTFDILTESWITNE